MFFKDISDNLKNALIARSNIFVMPSIKHKTSVEGFGIAYIEAAQYGIPSLGGKDGALLMLLSTIELVYYVMEIILMMFILH